MLATKGYGLSVDDIDWSSPADMKPYLKAHKEELKERDYLAWMFGQYTLSAVSVAVEHNLAGINAKSKYIEKPFFELHEENKVLTEEEIQREVDLFFATEKARRINWKRSRLKRRNNDE